MGRVPNDDCIAPQPRSPRIRHYAFHAVSSALSLSDAQRRSLRAASVGSVQQALTLTLATVAGAGDGDGAHGSTTSKKRGRDHDGDSSSAATASPKAAADGKWRWPRS